MADKPLAGVDHKAFISTTQGMSGWFAVHYWWNPEGFWEPWDTGFGRYSDEARAIQEAQDWAEAEGLEYKPRMGEDEGGTPPPA